MASSEKFVRFVADQGRGAGALTWRKMFGEYALYLEGKVVALICDDQLFVRPTDVGRETLGGQVSEGAPYPGARPHLLIVGELEQPDLLARLLRATAAVLPLPGKKANKAGATKAKKATEAGTARAKRANKATKATKATKAKGATKATKATKATRATGATKAKRAKKATRAKKAVKATPGARGKRRKA